MGRLFATEMCSGDCAHCGHNVGTDFTPAELKEIQDNANKAVEKYRHFPEIPKPPIERIQIVFLPSNRTPEEELERSKELLKPKKIEAPLTAHTVGDLSVVSKEKKEMADRWGRRSVNQQPGITVGDMTPEPAHGGLDDLFVGRPAYRLPVTKSQKFLEEKYENDAKVADARFLIQNPSELEKRAVELVPKIRVTLDKAERDREERRKEEAWREIEEQLRAKGIRI